jgi:hypothetical protein
MERIYIEYDMARFVRKDLTLVDVELIDGRKFQNLEPRRLFPMSGLEKYITLLDEEGIEKAVIRDLKTLPDAERKIIEGCLEEYYLIPRVEQILETREKFGVITFNTMTDRGPATIEIRNLLYGLKLVHGNRVLIRDGNDNRYEIPDINQLDKHSRQLLDNFL